MAITSTVTATPMILSGVRESLTGNALSAQQISHTGYDLVGVTLSASTDPPVTDAVFLDYALVAGTKTIDLTAVVDGFGQTIDLTGLKIQWIVLINPAGNNELTLEADASDGCEIGSVRLLGSADHATRAALYLPEASDAVGASTKNITITGTGTEAFKLGFLAG